MHTVALQAGHLNIERNPCDPLLAQGTGAAGEKTWTPTMRGKVAVLLRAHGFKVTELDANVNCLQPADPRHGPFDLTLAIHYQSWNGKPAGKGGNSGFGVFIPDADLDEHHELSWSRANAVRKIYAARTKLADYSDVSLKGAGTATWGNPNTRRYYLWLTQKGPLALIECGVGAAGAPDHSLLYLHADQVAAAIAEGICVAFGVKWAPDPVPAPVPIPAPPPPPVVPEPPHLDPPPVVQPAPQPPVVVVKPDPPVPVPPGGWQAFLDWLGELLRSLLGRPRPKA